MFISPRTIRRVALAALCCTALVMALASNAAIAAPKPGAPQSPSMWSVPHSTTFRSVADRLPLVEDISMSTSTVSLTPTTFPSVDTQRLPRSQMGRVER